MVLVHGQARDVEPRHGNQDVQGGSRVELEDIVRRKKVQRVGQQDGWLELLERQRDAHEVLDGVVVKHPAGACASAGRTRD